MGPDAPNIFTCSDKRIVMRGLLPSISIEASESEVRREISDVVRTCSFQDLMNCTVHDFEFIDMSGKQASIPRCKVGFEWNGRAVKELAGNGCVYVQLMRNVVSECVSEDDDEFPVIVLGQKTPPSTDAGGDPDLPCSSRSLSHSLSTPSTSRDPDRPCSSHSLSHSSSTTPLTSTLCVAVSEQEGSGGHSSPARDDHFMVESECSPDGGMVKMVEMFPDLTEHQLKCLVDMSDSSLSLAMDCALEGAGSLVQPHPLAKEGRAPRTCAMHPESGLSNEVAGKAIVAFQSK